jgi:1-acyl-sn-glycerol-3-phosphate acyltransferase
MARLYFIIKKLFSILFLIWCALVFSIFMIVLLPFILLPTWILKGKKMQDACFIFIKIWAWLFCTLCFFHIKVKGRKLINPNKAYIYISNHNSYLDVVAATRAIPGSFKPLGKIEILKVPIFGLIYRKTVVLIDRKNAENRAKCIQDLKVELAGGQSILIFPEGTMNRTDAPLAPFYDGAFRIAIETQTPIAPIAVINARKLLPRSYPLDAKPGSISLIFGEPITVTGLTEADLPKLKEQVHQVLESLIVNNS